MCQSHAGRLTGLWFLPEPAFGLNTNDDDDLGICKGQTDNGDTETAKKKKRKKIPSEMLKLEHQSVLLNLLEFYFNGYHLRVEPMTRWRRLCSKDSPPPVPNLYFSLQVMFITKSLHHFSAWYRAHWSKFSIQRTQTFKQIKLALPEKPVYCFFPMAAVHDGGHTLYRGILYSQ